MNDHNSHPPNAPECSSKPESNSVGRQMEQIGRLAIGVVHDINNMLGAIIGNAELTLDNTPPTCPLRQSLLDILDASRRSADITSQLLAFGVPHAQQNTTLDLNATIQSRLPMLRRIVGENIEVVLTPGNHISPIQMQPAQLDQILLNLCVNARDAIADAGHVSIETQMTSQDETCCASQSAMVPGKFVRLTVLDTGCGMDQDTLLHIFKPFYTTKGPNKGRGLGLATVHDIIERANGFVDVSSKPGIGTVFHIYLPACSEPPKIDKTSPATELPAPAGHAETILLVEDDPAILKLGKSMLERLGYAVLEAPSPTDALHLAGSCATRIDLLLVDLLMPDMDGWELSKRLLHMFPHLHVLLMSGYADPSTSPSDLTDHSLHMLEKPFTLQGLARKVRDSLDGIPPIGTTHLLIPADERA